MSEWSFDHTGGTTRYVREDGLTIEKMRDGFHTEAILSFPFRDAPVTAAEWEALHYAFNAPFDPQKVPTPPDRPIQFGVPYVESLNILAEDLDRIIPCRRPSDREKNLLERVAALEAEVKRLTEWRYRCGT
jgi:hypothetical protein